VGEYPLFLGPNFAKRVQGRDPTKVLGIKIREPCSYRLHEAYGVAKTAKDPLRPSFVFAIRLFLCAISIRHLGL
jgi:hypothetical protein